MKIDKIFSRVLLLAIPFYFTQGWLFGSGSLISQLLIGVWLLINIYYLMVYCFKNKRDIIVNTLLIFWIVNLVYWIISPKVVFGLDRAYETFGDLKNTTTVVLSYFPFSYFQKKKIIDEKYLKLFLVLFLLSAIVAFFTKQDAIISEFGVNKTNNTAYYFAVLLPFLGAFWGSKKFWIFYLTIIMFLLLCAKRGAIICGLISYSVFFMLSSKDKSKNFLSRAFRVIMISAIIMVIINYMYSTSDLLQERFLATQEGNTSERDYIYSGLWRIFVGSDFYTQAFGHGMSQTVNLIGGYAHNDWLELLVNEGVFGVILYMSFFISAMYYYHCNKKNMDINYRFLYITALLCLFSRSIFSMGYLAPESALFCVALACGKNNNKIILT